MSAIRSSTTSLERLRPSGLRSLRLLSGIVLLTYISLHLTNHALGNISLAAMERGLLVQKFIWQGILGTAVLYSALTVHFVLGLLALYERRRLHWTPAEFTQLVLGLAIPPLLANHLAVTRIAFSQFGLNKGYAQELYSFWIASPALGWLQLTLLIIAWLHGCLGLYFWLRLQSWFQHGRSWLLSIAVLLPVLALLGYLQGGREVLALAHDPAWLAQATAATHTGNAAQNLWLANLRNDFLLFDGVALGLVLLARLARVIHERRIGRIVVSYPDGRRQRIPLGFSVLEASLLAGIPHASMCGGRARCSLCRVRVICDSILPPPREAEQRVLARMGADQARVRLACQLRPTGDIAVLPLVPPDAQVAFLHRRQAMTMPEERFLVFMFVDMRDSTALAAARLPYDAVFIVGRFISAVSSGIVQAGGRPNQFLGDGVMAIFGLRDDAPTACRQALVALHAVALNIRQLGGLLAAELAGPLRFGIGVQCGRALVGEIGFRDYVTFTAMGDAPNVASRLEALTKELGCQAVVSEEVLLRAGLTGEALPRHDANLRGREEMVPARLFFEIEQDVSGLLGTP
jgi:adenylate cyclase